MVALDAAGRPGAGPLRQPAVGSAVRPRPRREPPRRRARDRVVRLAAVTSGLFRICIVSLSRLTASNTARASSCDTRSRIAPHSTSTVPVTVSIATSQRSRAMPSGRSSKLVGLRSTCPRDAGVETYGRDRRAVDQHADRGDQILVDRALAVVEARRVLAEQRQVVADRDLGDDRAAERALGVARAQPPPADTPAASSRGWRRQTSRRERATMSRRRESRITTARSKMSASVPSTGPSCSRARTRHARRWRSRTTRIFRWRRGCCRRRCGRTSPRSTPSRASPTTSPTKARRRRRSARRSCDAWQRRLHAAVADRAVGDAPHEHDDLIVRRARSLDSIARSADLAVRRSAERVRAGYHDDALRLVGRGARLLPAIGESGRPARAAHRRLSRRRARSIVGRAVHGAAADELLAGLRPRLARRPACTCRARSPRACGARRGTTSSGAALTAAVDARRSTRCVADDAPRTSTRAARVCDGVRGRLRFELRLTWLGGRGSSTGSSARRADAARPPADARRRATSPRCSWRAVALAARSRLMARKTSFYYSFLVLPAEQRRAIIAVWDFCRAVDDAVDEAPAATRPASRCRPAATRSRSGATELARCFDGRRAGDRRRAAACSRSSASSICRARRSRM